jgi:hypothetical protein
LATGAAQYVISTVIPLPTDQVVNWATYHVEVFGGQPMMLPAH